jgi:Tol biopolymer transport system component
LRRAVLNHMESKSPDVRLDSWKEIATYLKRDVRTVQRWEKLESLPVHRHQHLKRGSPFAYASELDAWWEGRGRSLDRAEVVEVVAPAHELVREAATPPARWFPRTLPSSWVIGGLALTVFITIFATIVVRVAGRAEPSPTLRRLSITLPDTEMRVPYRPTISPDGRQLALIGYDEKGTSRIWVRSLESLTPTSLAGTEGAEWPFWSPDSASIGFFAGGSLKIVALASGQTRIVTKAPNGRGGAWAGGTILFAPFLNDGLYSVPVSGGTPIRVTAIEKERGETSHRWPQFLPDGEHFIFFVVGRENVRGTHVGTLDGPRHTKVLQTNSVAVFNAGYLLFWRDHKLAAQAFNPSARSVHGPVLFLPDRIGYAQSWGISYASASQNGMLVYDPNGQSMATQLTWYDRSGTMLDAIGPVTSGPPWVTLARHTDQAAVQRWDSQARRLSIWRGDLRRGSWSRFTVGESDEMWPVWSPDGRRLAFGSTRSSGLAAIYEIPTHASSGEKLLHQESTVLTPMDWSPDGQYLLFQSLGGAQNRHIKALSLTEPRQVMKFPELADSQFDAVTARFSPDGKWVAYASNESGTFEVYVRPFPFTTGSKHAVSTDGGYSPRWRRDGKELFYLSPDRRLMSVDVLASNPLRLGTPQPLFELPVQTPGRAFSESPFDVSADGTRFLVDRVIRTTDQPLTVVLNWTSGLRN